MSGGAKLPPVPADLLKEAVAAGTDICIVVSSDLMVGQVLCGQQMTSVAARLQSWPGKHLTEIFAGESAQKLTQRLAETAMATGGALTLELNHAVGSGMALPMRYVVTRSGLEGGLLLLGRDLRPLADVQQRLVEAQMALQRDYEAQRDLEARYRVLMEMNRSPVMIVSVATGKIVDLNSLAATMIGAARADLSEASVAQEFEGRRRGEFLESLIALGGAGDQGGIELTIKRNRKRVQILPTLFRAGGDKLLLCRIEPTDVAREQSDELGEALSGLFQQGVDGVVFLDGEGAIKAANEAFLNMTDSPNQAAVVGRSLADFMTRGEVDLRVLLDNVKRVGRLRSYTTQLNTDFGGQVSVQMSATSIGEKPHALVALVIRDAATVEGMRFPAGAAGGEGLRNVMQLVGYSALKDIVSETTEIIEKMCIEAALELTGNNRVAAAELLSLSRQSLYVKLRKFGLMAKSSD